MKTLLSIFLFTVSFQAFAIENWTGEVKWVNVDENGSAYIFIDNPRSGPKSNFTCGNHNIVYLGTRNRPANSAFLSQALMVYTTGNTIRFGIRGNGDSCEATYISAR